MEVNVFSFSIWKLVCAKNTNKLVFAHMYLNSIRNKPNYSVDQIIGNVDIFIISDIKIHESFPVGNFSIDVSISPYID